MPTEIDTDTDTVMMPRALTAENGAKKAMIGEFIEWIDTECPACAGIDLDKNPCRFCDNTGMVKQPVQISWTTIKAIYAMAVKHLGTSPAA